VEEWAHKLGKERSTYGDIPNSGPWKHGYTGQFGGTYIFFPAGRSPERYYFTTVPGDTKWRMSKTIRVKGKVRKDWLIYIKKGPDDSRIKKPGPLWKWARQGTIVGKIPRSALTDLQNQTPLALYHSNVHISYYCFVLPDGKETEHEIWEPEIVTKLENGGYRSDFGLLPKTREPYPITIEEKDYLVQTRSARRAPPGAARSH